MHINQFCYLDTTEAWIVFSIGLPLFIIYAAALALTSYNLHAVKGRFHTKVLLRTQVMLILIEAYRLTTALCCCVQVWSEWYLITPIFDITIVSGQFLSIVFALA